MGIGHQKYRSLTSTVSPGRTRSRAWRRRGPSAVLVEALDVEGCSGAPGRCSRRPSRRLQRRHVGDIGIVAGLLDLADHVERAAGDDLGADAGVAQVSRDRAWRRSPAGAGWASGRWALTLPISGKASTPLPSSVYSPVSVGWPNTMIADAVVRRPGDSRDRARRCPGRRGRRSVGGSQAQAAVAVGVVLRRSAWDRSRRPRGRTSQRTGCDGARRRWKQRHLPTCHHPWVGMAINRAPAIRAKEDEPSSNSPCRGGAGVTNPGPPKHRECLLRRGRSCRTRARCRPRRDTAPIGPR